MSASFFSIKSNSSDRELAFSDPRRGYFTVELRGAGVGAMREVYDASGLAEYFLRLANFERPGNGAETWESLEGEFSLTAVSSKLGEVGFSVRITDNLGGPEQWQVSVRLVSELGQLPGIAREAESFFNAVPSA
jgi:hypothetical protein